MKNEAKARAIIILLITAVTLLNVLLYTRAQYVISGDAGLSPFDPRYLSTFYFQWQPLYYSGSFTPFGMPFSSLLYEMELLAGIIFGLPVWFSLTIWLPYLIGGVGMALLVFELTKNAGVRTASICGIISALVFTIHANTYALNLSSSAMFFPFAFLFLYYFASELGKGRTSLSYLSLTILSFSVMEIGGFTLFVQNTVLIMLSLFVLTLSAERGLRLAYVKYSLVIVTGVLAISLPVLISGLMLSHNLMQDGNFVAGSYSAVLVTHALPILGTLLEFVYLGAGTGVLITIAAVLVLLISLLSILYLAGGGTDLRKRIVLAVFSSYLAFSTVSATIGKPFGGIFVWLLGQVPYLILFRLPYTATYHIILFSISVLFGVGSAWGLSSLRNRHAQYVFFGLVLLALVMYVAATNIISAPDLLHVSIPSYVFQVSDYINSHSSGYSVAMLPVASPWQFTSWYFAANIYSSFMNVPVYSGGSSAYGIAFATPVSLLEYYSLGYDIGVENMSGKSVSNCLGVFGIKYIVVQGDASENSPVAGIVPPKFDLTAIYSNLNSSTGIKLAAKYTNTAIYLNGGALPLSYASNIRVIENDTMDGILNATCNPSLDLNNYSVYSGTISGTNFSSTLASSVPIAYSSAGKINVTEVRNFSKPTIDFVENDPTSVTVHVSNATTPFYLVFRETYDPHWAAYYENGTQVNSSRHIAVNGFANAWYINEKGNYTITLYYTLQTYAWIAWGVSFAALGAICCIWWFGYKQNARDRKGNKKEKEKIKVTVRNK